MATVRLATPPDAPEAAVLLVDFNREFDTPTPDADLVAPRLAALIAAGSTAVLLAGAPATGIAVVTYRPAVWHDGPVALLEELYVRPGLRGGGIGASLVSAMVDDARARGAALIEVHVDESDADALRFYEREGFRLLQPDTGERAFYLAREA